MKTHIKLSLLLTPAIFLLAFWILALSSGGLPASIGLLKMLLWALLLSFGIAYSITLFIREVLDKKDE
jgi:membrane protein implicated in regulation of membrane protease activity